MATADKDFSLIRPTETRDLAFDYRYDTFPLDPTETLMSAVVTITVVATLAGQTVDTNPNSRKSGPATITANLEGKADMAAVQRTTGMMDGNDYGLECLATTSRGQVLSMNALIKCRAA